MERIFIGDKRFDKLSGGEESHLQKVLGNLRKHCLECMIYSTVKPPLKDTSHKQTISHQVQPHIRHLSESFKVFPFTGNYHFPVNNTFTWVLQGYK